MPGLDPDATLPSDACGARSASSRARTWRGGGSGTPDTVAALRQRPKLAYTAATHDPVGAPDRVPGAAATGGSPTGSALRVSSALRSLGGVLRQLQSERSRSPRQLPLDGVAGHERPAREPV